MEFQTSRVPGGGQDSGLSTQKRKPKMHGPDGDGNSSVLT